MQFGLEGKRALVMGASSGLGRAIAQALINEGATVAICARDGARIEATATALGAMAFPCDLSEPGAAEDLVHRVTEKLGGINILVTNTGGPPAGSFLELGTIAIRISRTVVERRRRHSRSLTRDADARLGPNSPGHISGCQRADRRPYDLQCLASGSLGAGQQLESRSSCLGSDGQRPPSRLYQDRTS